MQIARCVREAQTLRGDSGAPRVLELSRRPIRLDEYLPEAIFSHHATHLREEPLTDGAFTLPFSDAFFDAVFVTDAYEHIPQQDRKGLVAEMLRVSRGVVLIGCPVNDGLVTRMDKVVFDFIWGKYAEEYGPLHQHFQYGLESKEEIIASLRGMGGDRVIALPCNYIYRWIHQILIFFDLQHQQPFPEFFESLNRIYNERISSYDYREPCYRYLMVIAVDPALDLDSLAGILQAPEEPPEAAANASGNLLEAYGQINAAAADRLRRLGQLESAIMSETFPARLRRFGIALRLAWRRLKGR